MIRLVPGTLCILLSFVLVIAAFIGIGLALRRAFGLRQVRLDDCFQAFWMGFAVVILALILWNFFFPVGGAALAVVLAGGAAGLLVSRRELASLAAGARPPAWALAVVLALALWLANGSLAPLTNWDSTLYHLQGVKWAHNYRAVPGLANLLGPLGFNNSAFLYDAMLDAAFWSGRAWHVANGVFLLAMSMQAIAGAARFRADPSPVNAHQVFAFLTLALVVFAPLGGRGASFDTDLPSSMLLLATTTHWYRSLLRAGHDPLEDAYAVFGVALLATLAVCLKLSAATFAATTIAVAMLRGFAGLRATGQLARTLRWSAGLPVLLGLAWMTRGVILSGYPLFPIRTISIPVEWRVPEVHAYAELAYVVHSNRASTLNDAVMSGSEGMRGWLPNWIGHLEDDPYFVVVPLLFGIVALGCAVAGWRRASPDARVRAGPGFWMLVPLALSTITWFAVSPEPRYVAPVLWSGVALALSQAWLLWSVPGNATLARRLLVVGWIVGLSPAVIVPLRHWVFQEERGNPITEILKSNLVIPPAGGWFVPPISAHLETTFTTASGLVLNIPAYRCWDLPLPCTHNPAPNLRLRVPGRLNGGFVVDGPWAMIGWPEKWRPEVFPAVMESWRRQNRRED